MSRGLSLSHDTWTVRWIKTLRADRHLIIFSIFFKTKQAIEVNIWQRSEVFIVKKTQQTANLQEIVKYI